MEPRKALLIAMKQKAGLATPAEVAVLDNTPLVIGLGLVVPRPSPSLEHWLARWGGVEGPSAYMPTPTTTKTTTRHE